MGPVSREVQRDRLHRTIWEVANELRGSVDGWDFKSYVLGLLFYRFISENLSNFIEANEGASFRYADLTDTEAEPIRDMMVDEKGFFILPSQLFENVRARAAQDPNLNETQHRTRTSTKHWKRSSRASKGRHWATAVKMTSRDCSTTSTSTQTAWATRLSAGMTS